MASLFNLKPRTSPRTEIFFGLCLIATGIFGVLRDDDVWGSLLVYIFIGIVGAWCFVRGLLRMRNEVPETVPSDASENPSENILHDPEFPPNKPTDE
jgi:uncharacterized membrane protein YfcA